MSNSEENESELAELLREVRAIRADLDRLKEVTAGQAFSPEYAVAVRPQEPAFTTEYAVLVRAQVPPNYSVPADYAVAVRVPVSIPVEVESPGPEE